MSNDVPTLALALKWFSFALVNKQRTRTKLVTARENQRAFTVMAKMPKMSNIDTVRDACEKAGRKMAALLHNKRMKVIVAHPYPTRATWERLASIEWGVSAVAEPHAGFVNFKVLAA